MWKEIQGSINRAFSDRFSFANLQSISDINKLRVIPTDYSQSNIYILFRWSNEISLNKHKSLFSVPFLSI